MERGRGKMGRAFSVIETSRGKAQLCENQVSSRGSILAILYHETAAFGYFPPTQLKIKFKKRSHGPATKTPDQKREFRTIEKIQSSNFPTEPPWVDIPLNAVGKCVSEKTKIQSSSSIERVFGHSA